MSKPSPTTVSILTPSGRGAVAVIPIEGPQSAQLIDQFFRPHRPPSLSERPLNRIVYGRWGAESAEDVIVVRRTPTQIEVHCHGGRAASRRIVDDLLAAGAQEQSWPTWIASHEFSSLAAATRQALSRAATLRTAEILLDQYHGALEKSLREILSLLDDAKTNHFATAAMIEKLITRDLLGLHLTDPWRVVVAGPPNVGKSSLMNALVGYERAIVFDQPGTTRDVVTALTAFSGWPVELSDTAGLRATNDPLESAGIDRAHHQVAAADCLLLVFDLSQPWTPTEQKLLTTWPTAIIVHNKSDLPPAYQPAAISSDPIITSTITSAGLDLLTKKIVRRLVPLDPAPGDAVPFTFEQLERLQAAAAALTAHEPQSARAHLLALLSSPHTDDAPTSQNTAPANRQ